MKLKNSDDAYGSAAKWFHWLCAIIIIGMLIVGFIMTGMEKTPDTFRIYGLHKSFGITLLALVALRLIWREINTTPRLPQWMRKIDRFGAHTSHFALYALMFAMPLSGWAMSSAAGLPVSVFGWFTLPNLVAPDRDLLHLLRKTHEYIAYVIIFVVSLHALAALLHHFYFKDNILRRMLWTAALMVSVGCAAPAFADVPTYTLVKEKSSVKFYAIQNGAPVEGKFNDFSADIQFDPDHLDKSSIVATVATGSIMVANEDIEKNLKAADWLSTDAFPKAIFKSTKITRMPSSDNYYLDGTLTLRGKTTPIVMNFQLKTVGNTCIAEGYMTLRRTDYNIGQGEWSRDDVIKNEVRVEFRIVANKN